MGGKFITGGQTKWDSLDWGRLGWISNPTSTGAAQLTVINAKFLPGNGHDFHKHPDQEEVIYVIAGQVEQWVDRDKRILGPGDAAFIPAGMVHASFNVGTDEVSIIAILGPCIGEIGYGVVEVADEVPWRGLRSQ